MEYNKPYTINDAIKYIRQYINLTLDEMVENGVVDIDDGTSTGISEAVLDISNLISMRQEGTEFVVFRECPMDINGYSIEELTSE